MSRPWNAEGPQAQLWLLLEPCGVIGLSFEAITKALPRMQRQKVSQNLFHLKQRGFVESYSALTPHMWRTVPGVQAPAIKGRAAPAATAPAAKQAEDKQWPRNYGEIAAKAGQLLGKAPAGLDTDALAQAIGCDTAEVDAALLPAVMEHVLTTCSLLRSGRQLVHYRLSAGPVMSYGWREQTLATWSNRKAEMMEELVRRGAPVAVPPPAPPAPAAPKPKPEVASEVLDAAPPPAPRAPGVPFVGELDIDAVHRKHPSAAVSAEEKALLLGSAALDSEFRQATQEVRDATDFLCALYSSGQMLIESGGGKVVLPLAHTRKLLHYLDHLRGDEFVESVLGELHS